MKGRKEIFDEMESTLGSVPSWMVTIPSATLEHDWEIFKAMELSDSSLSVTQKHLIGAAVAAANSCEHMAYWHAQMAMAMGANDTQVDEALAMARYVSGWSIWFEGNSVDMSYFKGEADKMVDRIKQNLPKAA
ncbi:MAG: carboxymuconolactone decarboxylase family protein [Actinomycetota bacterium]|nr:carboxymuconolactone decarboxylase family protein [Actinomycetota bacterium]